MSLPSASVILSFTSVEARLRWNWISACSGGFSPMKNWWPQNSSLRSSFVRHCMPMGTENSFASAACAAAYSWIGSR